MLRIACFSLLSLTATLALVGCEPVILAGGGGDGGDGGSSTTDSRSTISTTTSIIDTTSGTDTWTTSGTDTWTTSGTDTWTTSGTDTWTTSGTDTWTTSGTDTWTTSGTDTWTTSGTDTWTTSGTTTATGSQWACTSAGGVCVPFGAPDACQFGHWGSAVDYSCGDPVDACCLPMVCAPGFDQMCNQDPSMNAFAGHCNPDGTCTCNPGYTLLPNGKCM